jgi:hypothetical protein
VKFLESEGASAALGGEIGRERGDELEEVLGSGTEIEGTGSSKLSAARCRRLGKGAPGRSDQSRHCGGGGRFGNQ